MRNRAFYHYAINGFETNQNNAAVVDILYGAGKTPLHIFKKDAEKFIEAIISPEERRKRGINQLVGDEVEVLNSLLKGRAMILCTDFENYLEYSSNGTQNGIKEIAGLRIDGNIDLVEAFDYENLEPSIKVLYPN